MEDRQLFRVVNLGFEGEPIRHGLQNPETLQVVEYDSIKYVYEQGSVREAIIPDDPDRFILNENHSGYLFLNEQGEATLVFE